MVSRRPEDTSVGPVQLEIADLLLDLENPRIVGAKSQRDALQKIVEDQKEKLLVLARSIIEDEGMNPMDRLLVLKANSGFTVLEGNRRLAALKILAAPSILDDVPISTGLRRAFGRLSERFDRSTVEPLPGYEIASREDGVKWLHQRHTGENGGKGVVGWSGIAASRFRGQDPALQALAFVDTHGALTPQQATLLADQFPITTLDRLLSSREVRNRLGFDVKNGKLVSGLPPEELLKPLRQIVLDLAEGRKNVSQLKNKAQQIEYIEKDFPRTSLPTLSKIGPIRPVEEIVNGDFRAKPAATGPRKRQRAKRESSERLTLVPKNAKLSIGHRRIGLIFEELRGLKVAQARNAIAVLFRVFLELSVDNYMDTRHISLTVKDKGGHEKDKNLRTKVTEVVEHLVVVEGKNRQAFKSVLRALSTAHSPLSMELLNDYVHNRFTTPKAADLLASWDDAQQLFEALWT